MTRNGYSRPSIFGGWAIAIVYAIHSVITVLMPRTEKLSPLRETLRSWHYLLGLILFGLLLWRLWRWIRERAPAPPPGITPGAHDWARRLAFASWLLLAVMPILGIVSAWTDGLTVRLGPLFALPALLPENRAAWMFTGYFHSAFGFAVTLLTLVAALTGAWLRLRRGVGLVGAFPPGFGAQVWLSLGVALYAFNSFSGPEGGYVAVAVYVFVTLVIWGLGALMHRNRLPVRTSGQPGMVARFVGTVAILAMIGVAGYLPYQMFRVQPWPTGVAVAAPEGVTSHEAPVTVVTVTPETEFERQVRDETFKWCGFCHTFEKGGKHLVGPNLYAIFGQPAGTVPNFHYSPAMAEAGRNGLVWTDDTLDAFLAGPDEFLPGTSMLISTGPVKTPEERAAVINLLKKATMGDAIRPAATDDTGD